MKKLTALMMSLLMLLLCAACAPKEQLTVNVAAMKGPTGIGMAQLSSLAEEGKTEYNYSIIYAGSPDEVTGGLISGELDIAAVPVNLGAVLFNKTEGQILTAAVNTLGVLYVVENGNSVQSIADLAGRKICKNFFVLQFSGPAADRRSGLLPSVSGEMLCGISFSVMVNQ